MKSGKTPAKAFLLPGETTHGHYQIELSCSACHTPGMGVSQDACLDCHETELKLGNDTHAAKKFNDPTNADRLAILDAKKCITCHQEHVPQRTHPMGLSLPTDYCFHCHQDIGEQRSSHSLFAFDTCASAGCHNYHDNTALYENFLAQHWGEVDTLDAPRVRFPPDTGQTVTQQLTAATHDGPTGSGVSPSLIDDWAHSAHANAGVNCSDCHAAEGDSKSWSVESATSLDACEKCHQSEVSGFQRSRHGMRLSVDLPPFTPGEARLPMKESAAHRKLTCMACHSDHRFDTKSAAVDACLGCHDDSHSRAYKESSHFALWEDEMRGDGPVGSGVSCATCHLPRFEDEDGNWKVQHNQNTNLRPNEKMIRTVCVSCHGVAFSIDALADRNLIGSCFEGRPRNHVESVDMAKLWFEARSKMKNAKKKTSRRQSGADD